MPDLSLTIYKHDSTNHDSYSTVRIVHGSFPDMTFISDVDEALEKTFAYFKKMMNIRT